METATKILNDILELVSKKRFDLFLKREVLNEDFARRIRNCLEENTKYSENIDTALIEKVYATFTREEYHVCLRMDLWKLIVKMNKNPLSKDIGIALSDTYMIPDVIIDSHQPLEVYFVAANNSKYARSRLCIRLFIEAKYSVEDFKKYLDKYGKVSALRILQNRKPSSEDKYGLFSEKELKSMQKDWLYEGLDSKTKKQYRRNNKREQIIQERNKETKRIWENKNKEN